MSKDKLPDSQRVNFQLRLQMARNLRDYINEIIIPAFKAENRYKAAASVPISVDNMWVLINKVGATKDNDPFVSILIYGDLSWYYKEYGGNKKTAIGFKTEEEEEVIFALMKWLSKRTGIKI